LEIDAAAMRRSGLAKELDDMLTKGIEQLKKEIAHLQASLNA